MGIGHNHVTQMQGTEKYVCERERQRDLYERFDFDFITRSLANSSVLICMLRQSPPTTRDEGSHGKTDEGSHGKTAHGIATRDEGSHETQETSESDESNESNETKEGNEAAKRPIKGDSKHMFAD